MFFPWKTPKDKREASFSTVFSYFANMESNNDSIDLDFSFVTDTWMVFWTQEVFGTQIVEDPESICTALSVYDCSE